MLRVMRVGGPRAAALIKIPSGRMTREPFKVLVEVRLIEIAKSVGDVCPCARFFFLDCPEQMLKAMQPTYGFRRSAGNSVEQIYEVLVSDAANIRELGNRDCPM